MADTHHQTASGNPTFHRLWPTLFMAVTLPGHEQANAMLSGLVLEKNAEQEQMTTNYLEQNLMEEENPAILWLRQCFDKAVQDYAREVWHHLSARLDHSGLAKREFQGRLPQSTQSSTCLVVRLFFIYLNVPDQKRRYLPF